MTTSSPYIDELGETDAERYLCGCLDGTYVVGKKMKQLAARMLNEMANGYKNYRWDPAYAIKPVAWIEKFCCLTTGKPGTPFVLEPYERMILELTFGFVDENNFRRFHEVLLEIGRKNGKTEICAALNLYMLMRDGELAPQCYNASTTSAQAALCYGATVDMISQSKHLSKYLEQGSIPRRKGSGIKFKKEFSSKNRGFLVGLSRNTEAYDGLNVHYAVLDEMAAMRDPAVYNTIMSSLGSQDQPLVFMPSTENYVREGVWDMRKNYASRWLEGAIEDDHFLGICYELDDRNEAFDEEAWPKANPGLGTVKKWSFMRSEAKKAVNDPSTRPEFFTKQLNLPSNQASAFLTFEEACNPTTFEFDPKVFRYCIIGIDAADTVDLNAATALFMKPGDEHIYRRSMYWIPEEQVKVNSNNQRGRDGGVPYQRFADEGYLRIVPGNRVDHRCFIDWILELADEGLYCKGIGYDRWGMREIVNDMKMTVGEMNVFAIPFGPQSLSTPMKELKSMMRDGLIIDNNNPIDHMCNMNTACITDSSGNVKPIKKSSSLNRIDGFAALLLAWRVLTVEKKDEYLTAINT